MAQKILFKLLIPLSLFVSTTLFAQTKFEREYRLKVNEVPSKAQQYVLELGATKKVKWYKEISQSGKSIEAKTKIRNHCHSIEFTESGELEDVEVKIDWKEVEESTRNQIKSYFDNEFKRYKIRKIQRQYTGDAKTIKQVLLSEKTAENYTINYEIVVKGKKDGKVKLYEFLFSEKGKILEKLTIELRNTDNLEY